MSPEIRHLSRKRLKLLLPLAVLAFSLLTAFVLVQTRPHVETSPPEAPLPLVRAFEVQPRTVSLDVRSQGTVLPRTETLLSAEVGGRILEVSPRFAEGGVFRKSEILLQIDPRDYRVAVSTAEAAVAEAEVRLQQEEAEADVARREWEELGGDRGPADPLVLREPQLKRATAALEAAKATLQQARIDLERTAVRAPFAGRIREKLADLGQNVRPGAALARIYAVDYVEVELPIPVSELAYLDLDLTRSGESGPMVDLSAEFAGKMRHWSGAVVRTAGEIDPTTRMLPLIARVQDPLGRAAAESGAPLSIGLFVEAKIRGKSAEDVFVLPRGALRDTGGRLAPERGRVLIVEEEVLRFRDVEILRIAGDRVIINKGMQAGDMVCVSPLETPIDGMPVRVQPSEPPREETELGREVQS